MNIKKQTFRQIPAVPLDDIRMLLYTVQKAHEYAVQGDIVDEAAYNAMLAVDEWADEVARRRIAGRRSRS